MVMYFVFSADFKILGEIIKCGQITKYHQQSEKKST